MEFIPRQLDLIRVVFQVTVLFFKALKVVLVQPELEATRLDHWIVRIIYLGTRVLSSIIYSRPKMEVIQISFDRRINEQTVEYT